MNPEQQALKKELDQVTQWLGAVSAQNPQPGSEQQAEMLDLEHRKGRLEDRINSL